MNAVLRSQSRLGLEGRTRTLKIVNGGCYGLTMTSPPPAFLARIWIQQIRESVGVLYAADEVARADQVIAAIRAGETTDASREAGLRWEARERILQVADWLERWVGPAEGQQSQEQL